MSENLTLCLGMSMKQPTVSPGTQRGSFPTLSETALCHISCRHLTEKSITRKRSRKMYLAIFWRQTIKNLYIIVCFFVKGRRKKYIIFMMSSNIFNKKVKYTKFFVTEKYLFIKANIFSQIVSFKPF